MKKATSSSVKTASLPLHIAAARALRRAARTAREISRQTGTPLVLWRDGKVVRTKV